MGYDLERGKLSRPPNGKMKTCKETEMVIQLRFWIYAPEQNF